MTSWGTEMRFADKQRAIAAFHKHLRAQRFIGQRLMEIKILQRLPIEQPAHVARGDDDVDAVADEIADEDERDRSDKRRDPYDSDGDVEQALEPPVARPV